MSSTVIAKNYQVGDSITANQNVTIYQPTTPDGTVRIGVGNSGATTNDVMVISNAGTANFPNGAQVGGNNVLTTASSIPSATTATNLAGGTAGAVPYQSGSGTTLFTAVGSAGQVLQSNGTSAPTWVTPAAGGVTSFNTRTGAVTLSSGDVTTALGFTPVSSSGTIANATNLTGVAGTAGYSISGADITYGGQGGPQVLSQGGGAAMMTFHRPGAFAANFGLGTDNQLRLGGWSLGGNNYVILHSGNYGSYIGAMSTGGVGTYALLSTLGAAFSTAGATAAGSNLRYSDAGGNWNGTPSGTWRVMGVVLVEGQGGSSSIFLRIS